jgi:hypothetical protein
MALIVLWGSIKSICFERNWHGVYHE